MDDNTVICLDASEGDFRLWVARWLNANGIEWTRGQSGRAGNTANWSEITTCYAIIETPDLKRRFRLLVKITGTGDTKAVLLAAMRAEWPDAAELTADEWVYPLDESTWPEDTTTQGETDSGKGEPRGAKVGTIDRVKEAHRLITTGLSQRQACEAAKTDSRTYQQYCKEATGEDPIPAYR